MCDAGLNVDEGDFARKTRKRKNVCLHFARDALHVRLARRSPGLSFLSAPNLRLFIRGVGLNGLNEHNEQIHEEK